MIYKAWTELAGSDSQQAAYVMAWETAFWIGGWALLEWYIGEETFRFLRSFFSNFSSLFSRLDLHSISSAVDWVAQPIHWLGFLGKGDAGDWLYHGFIIWLFTGLPILLYRIEKLGSEDH